LRGREEGERSERRCESKEFALAQDSQ